MLNSISILILVAIGFFQIWAYVRSQKRIIALESEVAFLRNTQHRKVEILRQCLRCKWYTACQFKFGDDICNGDRRNTSTVA